MALNKSAIAKYTLLPEIFPRISRLFTSGFGHLAFYMAQVYSMVGLLPREHPYLYAQNIGRYGIRHVISEAASRLVFKRENADKILIFFIILVGLALILLQFILLLLTIIASQPVFAQNAAQQVDVLTKLFGNDQPTQDLIFIVFDKVFGLKGLFQSCVSEQVPCLDGLGNPINTSADAVAYPYPFHIALQTMFSFYSRGIFFVAVMVFIYMVITIIAETTTTGTPFGQRFNKAWVPIRIIAFFALLIPLNTSMANGMNGAQLVTLWISKYGSNFATNAWIQFNTDLTAGYISGKKDLVAMPNIPEVGNLNQFMLTAKTCQIAEETRYKTATNGHEIKAYIVRPISIFNDEIAEGNSIEFMDKSYDEALAFVKNGDIRIRFGVQGRDTDGDDTIDEHTEEMGNVFPYCGEITLHAGNNREPGAVSIRESFYDILQEMWGDPDNLRVANCLVNKYMLFHSADPNCPDIPNSAFISDQNTYFQSNVDALLVAGVQEQIDSIQNSLYDHIAEEEQEGLPDMLLQKGWAGAAIWFQRIAEMNGAITTAVFNIPRPDKYPYTLEEIAKKRKQENPSAGEKGRYNAVLPSGTLVQLDDNRQEIYKPMYAAYIAWGGDNLQNSPQTSGTDNIIINILNGILGTSGIFDMRRNADTHPLAQLTAIGKGMMEATVRNMAVAVAGTATSGLAEMFKIDAFAKDVTKEIANFAFGMVTAAIGIGVVLFYVLPLLPFIYFLFAFSGWIKSIFEAIVAMPLWALSHLHIDGEGLPGEAAASGYYLLLEIFIRPILILFGLLASISIFAALVSVLNDVFDLVINNVGGFDTHLEASKNGAGTTAASVFSDAPSSIEFYRGPVDEFFFTALYAIICYMTGLACFKMVDLIPNSILRWMGITVATFQENAGDPASQLSSQVYKGSILLSNQVRGATQGDLLALTN